MTSHLWDSSLSHLCRMLLSDWPPAWLKPETAKRVWWLSLCLLAVLCSLRSCGVSGGERVSAPSHFTTEMDLHFRSTKITYRRWEDPDNPRCELDFVGQSDESPGTENELCTVSSASAHSASGSALNQETFTVEDALDAMGFGRFQWKMALLTGLSWVGDAMETMILSILGPELHCEWSLPGYQTALITSVVFLGMGISSPIWGTFSDKFGRKVGLVLCIAWTLYFAFLSSFAPVYGWLLVLRGLVGLGIGGAPQSVTLYSEFLPVKARGLCIMAMAAFWSLGAVLEVLLALWVMPTLGWRWLLGLSTFPMMLFVCCCYWLPESPRFEVLMGRSEKAMKTLKSIARQNGRALPRGRIRASQAIERGQMKELFTPQYRVTTLLLWFIWFSFAFSYYGLVLLTTEMFQAGHSCGTIQAAKIVAACSLECKHLTSADYKDLLWTTLAEFPGLVLVVVVVERLGRKKSMALCFFMFSLFILPLYACLDRTALTIFIFIGRAFISGGYQVVFVYTPEVFPTEIRALAMGTSSAMGRLGALITPFVAQVMLRTSLYLTLSMYCGISVLAGVASLFLPIETLGRALQESGAGREVGGRASATSVQEAQTSTGLSRKQEGMMGEPCE